MQRIAITLRNTSRGSICVVVEPWAREYDLPPGAEFRIVAVHEGDADNVPTIQVTDDATLVWVEAGGFELWQGGAIRDSA